MEGKLQEIQSALSGGKVLLPSATRLPHLNLVLVATVYGPSNFRVMSLWVPRERRFEVAGFTLT
jgi:hypothetical protein